MLCPSEVLLSLYANDRVVGEFRIGHDLLLKPGCLTTVYTENEEINMILISRLRSAVAGSEEGQVYRIEQRLLLAQHLRLKASNA